MFQNCNFERINSAAAYEALKHAGLQLTTHLSSDIVHKGTEQEVEQYWEQADKLRAEAKRAADVWVQFRDGEKMRTRKRRLEFYPSIAIH